MLTSSRDKRSSVIVSGFCCSCFFFFQAEDGIRDLTVTGVQTCALPISTPSSRLTRLEELSSQRLATSRIARLAAHHFSRTALGVRKSNAHSLRVVRDDPEIGRASCRERV